MTLELAVAIAGDPLDRRVDRSELRRDLAELGDVMIEVRLAHLHARLRLRGRLRRRDDRTARRARRLELCARRVTALGRELRGLRQRGIGDQDQFAEPGQLLAPVARQRLGIRRRGRARAREPRALGLALGIARVELREHLGRGIPLGRRLGERRFRGRDQVIERASPLPRMILGTAQRTRLALDELCARVLVAGRLA